MIGRVTVFILFYGSYDLAFHLAAGLCAVAAGLRARVTRRAVLVA